VAKLTVASNSAGSALAARLVRFAGVLGCAYQVIDDIEDRERDAALNLARVVGTARAITEARELLASARSEVQEIQDGGGLCACVDWFERRLDAAS
jgi:hypothetical protein